MKKNIKVGIIGLGLIGGSLLKCLSKNKNFELFCASKSSYKKALKYTKNSSDDINILKKCEIIFVAVSITKTKETLEELNKILPSKTIVVDVASVKKDLLDTKYNFNFILSHPMAGTEKSGFSASDENLFKKAKWLYEKENKLLLKIIKATGAIPLKINMKEHDEMCAQISHFPAILSVLLFNIAQENSKQLASSGFRDATRLAMGNWELTNSMFEINFENIELCLNKLNKDFENLKKLSPSEKIELFKNTAQKRAKMYDKNGKNIFKI